jgi:SnoaL-like domain
MMDEAIVARLAQLEAVEEIRRLKAAYCAACDDDHNGDRVAALFIPEGTWQSSNSALCTGHDEIRAYMHGVRDSGRLKHSSHMVTNPVIEVNDDEATGTWSFLMMYTSNTGAFVRIIGFYDEHYTRRDGRWLFRSLKANIQDSAAYGHVSVT